MNNQIESKVKKLLDNVVFAVVRLDDPGNALKIVDAIIKGGVKNIEITLTTPNAYELISEVSNEYSENAEIGVGSALNEEMAIKSIEAGATFVVTPILNISMIDVCHKRGVPIFTGAYSPTEIYTAASAGADIIKVFPANIVGMEFFKAIKAPMPDLKIMPTGGVNLTNAHEWLEAGACAVGIGSALIDKQAIEENNFDKLKENAELLMSTIRKFTNKVNG